MSEKEEVLRVNAPAIRGGPISGFLVVIVVSHIQCKKGLPTRRTTLRNFFMESTSCGLNYGALPYEVIRLLHVSLAKDESETT